MQQRLARGEAAALGELYDRFASLVHSLAHRVLGDEKAADRITREVFGYIWENPDAYDPKQGSMRSWVARITQGQAVARLRQAELGRGSREELEQKVRSANAAARADYIVTSMPAPCGPRWNSRTSSGATTGRPPPTCRSVRTRRGAGCASDCSCCRPPTPSRRRKPPGPDMERLDERPSPVAR